MQEVAPGRAGAVLAAAAHGRCPGLLALLGRLSGVLEQQAEAVQPSRDPEPQPQARGSLRRALAVATGPGAAAPLCCPCTGQQPTGRRPGMLGLGFPIRFLSLDNQSLPGLRVH